MERLKSLSDKRLIIECKVNNKSAYFLIDTGATIGLINQDKIKEFDLLVGNKYRGTLIGIGGEINNIKHCNTFICVGDRSIPQFLLADISSVVNSIKDQTGIEILGIISLNQLKIANISIDCNDNEIILE